MSKKQQYKHRDANDNQILETYKSPQIIISLDKLDDIIDKACPSNIFPGTNQSLKDAILSGGKVVG